MKCFISFILFYKENTVKINLYLNKTKIQQLSCDRSKIVRSYEEGCCCKIVFLFDDEVYFTPTARNVEYRLDLTDNNDVLIKSYSRVFFGGNETITPIPPDATKSSLSFNIIN